MKKANLPVENASEPQEGAYQPHPENKNMPPFTGQNFTKKLTFAKDVDLTDNRFSQNSYKEVLSQPPSEISHSQKLLWLQKRRSAGLWAQCDACDKWRYLPNILDRHELPAKWYCSMNTDKQCASCSIAEAPLCIRDEEDLIHSEYSAGSLVWARLGGWPWWPAMVCDCPDAEQYYWLDGLSDIPTHYNVVFFDKLDATRAWISPDNLKPYSSNKKSPDFIPRNKRYNFRLKAAVTQANEAESMPLMTRLDKFSFISRHKGEILSPKKIGKKELRKYQKRFKNKYNVEFPIESETDEEVVMVPEYPETTANKNNNNLIMLGTPKRRKKAESVFNKIRSREHDNTSVQQNTETDKSTIVPKNVDNELASTDLPSNSLAVQVGSTEPDFDNDSSKTYVPKDTESTAEEIEINVRVDTPNSEDFDF